MKVFAEFINVEKNICYFDPRDVIHVEKKKSKTDKVFFYYEVYLSVLPPNEYYEIKASSNFISRLEFLLESLDMKKEIDLKNTLEFKPSKFLDKQFLKDLRDNKELKKQFDNCFALEDIGLFADVLGLND